MIYLRSGSPKFQVEKLAESRIFLRRLLTAGFEIGKDAVLFRSLLQA